MSRPLGDYDFNEAQKRPAPTPGISDPDVRTVSINVHWVPHVAGLLLDLADEDVWLGTQTEKENAVNEVTKLLVALGN